MQLMLSNVALISVRVRSWQNDAKTNCRVVLLGPKQKYDVELGQFVQCLGLFLRQSIHHLVIVMIFCAVCLAIREILFAFAANQIGSVGTWSGVVLMESI